MGRIVFNADVFRPSQLRAPRQPESRSTIGDQWLTPRGVLTAATLAKMAGGLKLPAGWRDEGVDANTEALKAAATARQQAKDKIEKDESDARARRAADTSDEAAMQMSADIKPGTLAAMRDETMVRARARAVELEKQGKMQEAMDVLGQAGDRIGQMNVRMGPEERQRRRSVLRDQQKRRQRRLAAGDQRPRADQRLNIQRGDYQGLREDAVRDATALSPEAAEEAFNEAFTIAQEEGRVKQAETEDAKQASADAFKAAGLAINLDDLKGEGSEKVRNLSRDQLRDILVKWKQGDKQAVMSEISNLQGDQQEVAAFEELLIRQMNRRRSQEAGVRGVDRLMTEAEETKISEEAADKFLADKRRDDPYYGMRPEDAVRQIMVDAPLAKTDKEQRKLRSLMQHYTPTRQTFADLFFDNTNERSMANIANLNKLFPDPEKELTKLERARQTLELLELTQKEEFLRGLKPEERKMMLDLRFLKARIEKEEALGRKVRAATRGANKGGVGKALKLYRDDFNKNTDAKFKIDSLTAKADALLKRSKSKEADGFRQKLGSGLTLNEARAMSANSALPPEAQKALDELAGALAARDRYIASAGTALTNAQAAAEAGNTQRARTEFARFEKMNNAANEQLLNRTPEVVDAVVDTLKAAVFGRSR